MSKHVYEFERLSTKKGFNDSLKHFQSVSALLGDFESKYNLADILNEMLSRNELEAHQLHAIVYALLVDKYDYSYKSYNMPESVTDFASIIEQTSKIKAVDIVLAYFHPELGLSLINPKNKDSWEAVNLLKKDELVVVYAGGFSSGIDPKISDKAINFLLKYFEGRKGKLPDVLTQGKYPFKKIPKPIDAKKASSAGTRAKGRKPVQKASVNKGKEKEIEKQKEEAQKPQKTGKFQMTPMYSVTVTNELFHNGNVEAWKKIIESYKAKHPNLEVYIYYDGERIHDINTLFKWGKVKHGSAILFAVAGENISDVAKLQRYFKQGASSRFEDFLRFPVNTILNLF